MATPTRITGTITFEDQITGAVRINDVAFQANSAWTWVQVVDHATELATPKAKGHWAFLTENLYELC